jgi:DNA-binding MarR family transcriptional regulator
MSKNHSSDSHVEDLISHLRSLTHAKMMFKNGVASKMHLNISDAECIDFLIQMGSSTAGDLARVTGLTTGAVTSVIDRLEKGGYVRREKNPNDRRKVMVVLIPERNKSIRDHYDPLNAEIHNLLSDYGKKELKILISCMKELNSIYHRHTNALV